MQNLHTVQSATKLFDNIISVAQLKDMLKDKYAIKAKGFQHPIL